MKLEKTCNSTAFHADQYDGPVFPHLTYLVYTVFPHGESQDGLRFPSFEISVLTTFKKCVVREFL